MPTLLKPVTKTAPFPLAAVESCLRAELIESVKEEAPIRGIALPSASADIAGLGVSIDSLIVVSLLCTVEPLLGFELTEDVVRSGGYVSVNAAVAHLVPRIEKEWNKRKGAKP